MEQHNTRGYKEHIPNCCFKPPYKIFILLRVFPGFYSWTYLVIFIIDLSVVIVYKFISHANDTAIFCCLKNKSTSFDEEKMEDEFENDIESEIVCKF